MNKEKKIVLSVDIGTQSIRVLGVDENGDQILNIRRESRAGYSLKQGWLELVADRVWIEVSGTIKEAVSKLGEDKKYIKCCSIAANRNNIIPIDENGYYLRDWITWMDLRKNYEIMDTFKKDQRGVNKMVQAAGKKFFEMLSLKSKFNWIKYNEPEIYKKTKKFLTISGLVIYKLTNQFNDIDGMQVGIMPFNARQKKWYPQKLIHDVIGVSPDKLANIYGPGEVLGTVSKKASYITGLPMGVEIISGGGDKQCETLGSGALSTKQAVISYGTMATISTTVDRYVANKKYKFYTWPSPYKGHWHPEFYIERGYWLVTWFCNQYANKDSIDEFLEDMNTRAAQIPAGSNGLFVYPFWSPHYELYPEAKGCVMGLGDNHTRAHLFRAILESIAFSLKDGLDLIEKCTRQKTEELYVVGGGANSDVAMQITADIFNLKVIRLQNKEVCAVGTILPACLHAGVFKDMQEGIDKMLNVKDVFIPNPDSVQEYKNIYKKIYKKIYRKNLSIFRQLNKLKKM